MASTRQAIWPVTSHAYRRKPAQGLLWSGGACNLTEYRPEVARRTMTMYFGINDAGALVGHWATDGGFSTGLVYNKGDLHSRGSRLGRLRRQLGNQ